MTDRKPVILCFECSQCGTENLTRPPDAYELSLAVSCKSCGVMHVFEYRIRLAYPGEQFERGVVAF